MSTVTCKAVGHMGRLGNIFFQMAATIGYAFDNGKNFIFPKWDYQDYITINIGECNTTMELSEQSLRYNKLPYYIGNCNIHGHFLSTKYFNKHKEFIQSYFRLLPVWEKYIYDNFGHLFEYRTCSLHVRRGDYLQKDQLECNGLMPLSYFEKAVDLITKESSSNINFIVCSDDISWCKENFKGENFFFIEGQKDIIDLFIMSKCDNNIISNSSFSWWAAYLNKHENKKVIAPKQWFTYTEGWTDLYDENWIVL